MKDTPEQILPEAYKWCELFSAGAHVEDKATKKADWDKKSVNFVQKNRKEDYIDYLIERMALEPGDTVFDMGCGAGTLAIPLARRGYHVYAVDFSDGMLAGLREYAKEQNVEDYIEIFQRAWQDDLSDLPIADIAVSSRSLIVDNLADALAKLESKARKRCVVTLPVAEIRSYEKALGIALPEEHGSSYRAKTTLIVSGYLASIGRLPKVDYIAYPHQAHANSAEDLIERTLKFSRSTTPENESQIRAWMEAHIVPDKVNGGVCFDVIDVGKWAYVEWDIE